MIDQPPRPPRRPAPARHAAALEALASSVRQEVLSELAEGPGTVKDLSRRLGRSRQALHFHMGVLERAELVAIAGERGEGRARERVYRVVAGALDLRARKLGAAERASAARAAQSMLRTTQREIVRTLHEEKLGADRGGVPAIALRAKARLDARTLAEVQRRLLAIARLFRKAKGKNPDRRMLALTVVLTPAREARQGDAVRRRSRRSSS
jgi:DNA-binding transcriptional ArsR family regulator